MNSAEKEAVLHCLRAMIDEELCEECPLYGTTGTDHCEKDCVRLAIGELEKKPCCNCIEFKRYAKEMGFEIEQESCEDVISRQAVEEMIKAEMPERGMWEIEGDKEKETVCEVCVDLMQKLSKLPPVTPQPKSEWQHDHEILKAYSDGVNEVLDKIRAEIDTARFIDKDTKYCKNANATGLEVALDIIDKYKAESEEV